MEFVDEYLSTKYYCMHPTVPVLLDMGTLTFNPVSGGKIELEVMTWSGPVVREVWMDGRTHPPPLEAFYQGHSVGWYEDGDLFVETTNFTFDVDGLDDHAHIPSSQMKKVTERYRKLSPDGISMTVTHEDPLFLKAPYTWTRELRTVPRPEVGKQICNRESAIRELKLVAPDKYEGQ